MTVYDEKIELVVSWFMNDDGAEDDIKYDNLPGRWKKPVFDAFAKGGRRIDGSNLTGIILNFIGNWTNIERLAMFETNEPEGCTAAKVAIYFWSLLLPVLLLTIRYHVGIGENEHSKSLKSIGAVQLQKSNGYLFLESSLAGLFYLSDSCRIGENEALKEHKLIGIKTSKLMGDCEDAANQERIQVASVLIVCNQMQPTDL
ncbi:hypothetical protein Tco_0731902 [Tanacetum coccineum]